MDKIKVLIAEDSITQAMQLQHNLEKNGYDATVVSNGSEALRSISKSKPLIVISDIIMPEMDGYELCRQIKSNESYRDISVILLTSLSQPQDVIKALQCNADKFLTKPCDENHLISTVQHLNENLKSQDPPKKSINISYKGETYSIDSTRSQIINLLLSTYEAAVNKNLELIEAQDELKRLNQGLEEIVDQRTASLRAEVNERKAAEEVLRISEERYRTLFESMDEGFCVVEMLYDPDGKAVDYRFVEINPAFDKHTGLPQALGKTIRQMVPNHDAHWFEIYGKVARTGEAIRFENPAIAMQRYYDVYAFRIGGDGSQRVGVLFNDITIRKAAEAALQASIDEVKTMSQQLLQAEKLATMGELASSIAHELNNPLATVSLRVESLIAQTTGDDPRLRELEIIGQEVERMGNLVSNLLQFSRRSQPQISTVNVRDEIEKTLELAYYHLRKHNIAVVREFKSEGPLIHADRQQLRQLFLNLFTNAGDAMPEGGTLTIRVTTRPEEKQVCIEIVDTGVGILPDILPKVLEPFYTTKPEGKGTGLGLAICRRIANNHSGRLEIMSDGVPRKGTKVCITLPFSNGSNSACLRDE